LKAKKERSTRAIWGEAIMLETIKNCSSMEWQEAGKGYPSGTKIKVLRDDDGGRTVILLLPRGFKMEGHSHIYSEQHFVLKGQYEIGEKVHSQGTYQLIHPNTTHGPFTSRTGAEVLVIWN
jgi:anti-sigma factor ChrR (cupin superfamily)